MNSSTHHPLPQRAYRQGARAVAAEATARRILEVFSACMRCQWFDEITLEDVARQAHVTVRTIIRRFGGKEGLLEAFVDDFNRTVRSSRDSRPGDVAGAVAQLAAIYEEWGDSVIRNLAQEERHPALKRLLDLGRANHRASTAAAFAPWLERLAAAERARMLDELVLVTDVYAWKLLRRDIGHTAKDTARLVRRLVDAVLAQAPPPASIMGDER